MFQQEIKYWMVGGPIGVLAMLCNPGGGATILLLTWLFCRTYHVKRITTLLKHGPKDVIGMFYRSNPDYEVWKKYLREHFSEEDLKYYFMIYGE